MDTIHGSKLGFVPTSLTHRTTDLKFKILFEGDEGTPENYQFAFVEQSAFYSPVHRHNFDQLRYAYRGNFSITPNLTIKESEISYHPESVFYSPQDDGHETRVLLILQFGGASGQGYLSQSQLLQANKQLMMVGKFEQGKFFPGNGTESIDGFQALWEYCNGKSLIYPKKRYQTPILMTPANFAWKLVEDGASEGTYKKLLVVFSERGTVIAQMKIESGGIWRVKAKNAVQFIVVLKGSGQANGEICAAETAIRLQRHRETNISAIETMETLHYVLPLLDKGALIVA
ncbi:hypothetical protein JMJ35_000666 [Cladonia borealis]|uniref:Uncharacterized protein n=1 Tax=Cladonia borealis TaxID=184061 RepID=A0AA39UFE7_9LECA|nr:hypothetical protein JMJ35_000666 [Cladonia borealis]